MDKALSIGELAERSGISVRALRLYEAEGLIKPVRTQAGRRVYQAGDVARLQQILLLKKAGCTLGQIGQLLDKRPFDPARLIDAQSGTEPGPVARRAPPAFRWGMSFRGCPVRPDQAGRTEHE